MVACYKNNNKQKEVTILVGDMILVFHHVESESILGRHSAYGRIKLVVVYALGKLGDTRRAQNFVGCL